MDYAEVMRQLAFVEYDTDAYDELVDLLEFCLITRVPLVDAYQMNEVVRAAYVQAYNTINKER